MVKVGGYIRFLKDYSTFGAVKGDVALITKVTSYGNIHFKFNDEEGFFFPHRLGHEIELVEDVPEVVDVITLI